MSMRALLRELPFVVTSMLLGAVLLGGLGALVGIVVGLNVNPPTAWFAALEVGVPAGLVGCLVGLVIGLVGQWVGGAPPRGGTPCG